MGINTRPPAFNPDYPAPRPVAYNPDWVANTRRNQAQNVANPTVRVLNPKDECSICFEAFKEHPQGIRNVPVIVAKTACDHFFHNDCIKNWVHNGANQNCPICRKAVKITSLITVDTKPAVPMRPAPQQRPIATQPAAPQPSIGSRVFSVAKKIASVLWKAIIEESAETIKTRKIETEHRTIELQIRVNKWPVLFNDQKEKVQIGIASVRSILENSKAALKAVKDLELVAKKFEDNLKMAQSTLLTDMKSFEETVKAAVIPSES